MSNPQLQTYVDYLVVEALLSNPRITKKADGEVAGLIGTVKDYILRHIDKENPISSVLGLLVPGALAALGFPMLAGILKVAEMVLGFDIADILRNIGSYVTSLVSGGKKTDSETVKAGVMQAVNSQATIPVTDEDMARVNKFNEQAKTTKSSALTLDQALFFKKSVATFLNENPDFDFGNPKFTMKVYAKWSVSDIGRIFGFKITTGEILVSLLGWIVTTALATAGFMVAEDGIHALLGQPNHFDGSAKPGAASPQSGSAQMVSSTLPTASTQRKFQVNPNYSQESFNSEYDSWIIKGTANDLPSIIANWATEIYPDVDRSSLASSANFKTLLSLIEKNNEGNTTKTLFMPKFLKSRKQVVDTFIDDVANHSSSPTINGPPGAKPPGIHL